MTTGRVTIGSRPIDGRPGRIRVEAAHRGSPTLEEFMGLSTTADRDGRFQLRGLSAGRYEVQASRDGIWTSKTVAIDVVPGTDPLPIALDIPASGATVALRLERPDGSPLAGRVVRPILPEGPLDDLRPDAFRTGLDGEAIIPGLGAGRHLLAVAGVAEPFPIDVPGADEAPEGASIVIRAEAIRDEEPCSPPD